MKKKIFAVLFATLMAFSSNACSLLGLDNSTPIEPEDGKVATISASLLDGKVANLLLANGVGIQRCNRNLL